MLPGTAMLRVRTAADRNTITADESGDDIRVLMQAIAPEHTRQQAQRSSRCTAIRGDIETQVS
jgi:hypothetical protein